jgi:hypothetical protein
MNENAKKEIEKLKEIVMRLHRSAGMLDNLVQQLEFNIGNDLRSNQHYVEIQADYREGYLRITKCANCDDQEKQIWANLIASFKEEES